MRTSTAFGVLVLVLGAACAPATPAGSGPGQPGQSNVAAPKAITIAITEDPGNIWDGLTGGGGSGSRELGQMVNQFLTTSTSDGVTIPRLLSELPSIERGTWRALPDSSMQTTFKLRGDVTWHDGQKLTADDVVFSWRVNRDPDVPNSNSEVIRLISAMDVHDPATIVATWSQPYPFADRIGQRELLTVPEHLLKGSYTDAKDGFLSQAYFSDQYVGLGPYRLTRWERGSAIDMQAFDQYFRGRPKIDSVRVLFIQDPGTLTANLKAHTLTSYLPPGTLSFDSIAQVGQEWEASGYGQGLVEIVRWKSMQAQTLRNPQPADLADARARQALLSAINRPELAHALYGEYGTPADSWIHPSFRQYAQVQDAIMTYPYDTRRTLALLGDLGWQRGADGSRQKTGQRFALTLRDSEDERGALIIADNWKGVGISGTFEQQTPQELRDRQKRAEYTGVNIERGSLPTLTIIRRLNSDAIPTPENKFAGSNRGGYSSSEWDELGRRFLSALEEPQRAEVERDLLRRFTTDLPQMPLAYDPDVILIGGGLTGLAVATTSGYNGQLMHTWNINEWDLAPAR